jgi:gliding motility-associated-like protein
MKKLLILSGFLIITNFSFGQLISTNAAASGPTNYQTVSYTDSIYYYCGAGNNGELTAIPESGTPNWTFTWQQFDPATNAWIPHSIVTNATTSTISNLAPGGYRVSITDAGSNIVGCYRAWIVNILSPTTVDVAPIPPGCGAVQLNGTIDWGSATPYYEPPAEPILIDATTQISVCFNGNHTWVSDLAFYLVAPPTCGSATVLLSPNPGAIGQNSVCNSGDNINNLCFTTSAAANLDVCNPAPNTLSGTYSSYGPTNTPINWSSLYGCNAAQPGWAVQIYDCISADVGALTHATITISGTTACGDFASITYDSGNINSVINDNSCSPGSASIFQVPASAATIVAYDTNFIWTAVPNITIPGATTDLTPLVNPGPTVTTVFTLSIDTTGGAACIPAVCGGNWQDSETYIYTPPTPANLIGPATICTGDPAVQLIADVPGGFWSGTGVSPTGLFDPSALSPNSYTVMYTVSNPCPINSFITIQVVNGSSIATIPTPAPLCEDGTPINLTASPSGGTWSGTGITDPNLGTFDPAATPGVGTYTISYQTSGSCPSSGTVDIEIITTPDASFTIEPNICANDPAFLLVPATTGGTWSGTGVNTTSGLFDPSVSGAGSWPIVYTLPSCNASSTANVVVNALPNVNASADQSICPGDSIQIMASGASDYVWTPATDLSDDQIADPFASPSQTTTYLVTGTDANGCSDTADVTISIFTPATVTFSGGTQVCLGDSVLVTANNISNVSWTPSATVSSPNNASTFVMPTTNTTYTVTGDDANGCAVSGSVSISVNTVNASITATPDYGTVPLTVDFTNGSSNGIIYIWNYGDGNMDTTNTLAATQNIYTTEGIYTATLTAISAAGCTDISSVMIVVYPECVLTIPNVFSPNGDNTNDVMTITCTQILRTMNMKIYDRWGKLVAELTDPNQTWNGNGQSEGTFYYIFNAEGYNSVVYNLTGYISLMR